ncbi:hypothetical protein EUTSA_v10017601mg [Eutrema salsugineum]|uniref:Phytocyanin domain-containing protein n=1 Tax=Eutrema salsugineum TaxID=72664 RepID=V4NWK1_EUTSA|nr:uncharacterized protein LOC18027312 [Eutrema salsugineum]ESQ51231.1 hypothetical protein EUTSA_v10017601mg [Eutrema salsugineum]
MATTTRTTLCFVFVMMSFTILMGRHCSAKIYKVGDSKGWTAKADTYYDWAQRNEFDVGDSLLFEYDRNFNDVTQVSSALAYDSCDSSSPKAVYNTGNDTVTLKEPGYHYFISSNHAQCVAGQKLEVLVVCYDPSRPCKIFPFGKTYKVGDSNEWSVPKESDLYYKWSEEKQFHVGDSLLFCYDDEVNDVLEVRGDLEFKSCDPSSPVAVHNSGQDLIRLTKPGIHYFITSKTGHCEDGLKLRVVVRPLHRAVWEKRKLSPLDRLIKWLQSFRPHPHH